MKARGVEYPSVLQVEGAPTVDGASELPKEEVLYDLESVISAFGEKEESAIRAFVQIISQIIVRNNVYLVHNNRSIGKVVKGQLDALFADQKTSLEVISYDEIDGVAGMRPTIFDLQYGTFISEGIKIETVYFENLVEDALSHINGFNLLRNEFSKLMFSYRRLWELLTSGAKKYTQKRIAYLVSIDHALIPLLLQIAENDGIDVSSRVGED